MKVTQGTITSQFGMRKDPITGEIKMHNGVDIAAPAGTPIYAPSNGQIVSVGFDIYNGNRIRMQSEFITFIFCHLQRIDVCTGLHIKEGHQIGTVGNSGRSTGYHLHFQVERNMQPINPLPFLEF